jgi:hypothetical protein
MWRPLGAATGAVVTLMRFVWEITDFPYIGWLKITSASVGPIIDRPF